MISSWGKYPLDRSPYRSSPSDEIFARRLADVGLPDVFYQPKRNPQDDIINLGNLQRMVLHVLQRELVQEVRIIQETSCVNGNQAERIRVALSKFCENITFKYSFQCD